MLLVAAVTAVIALCLWVLFSGRIAAISMQVARELHLVPRLPPAPPANLPLETVAADLRRLRRELDKPLPGLPMTKRRAILQAYDDRLLDACRELDVPAAPAWATDRETERLRLELLLGRAGLVIAQRFC